MARKGYKRKFPPLEILTREDVNQVHITTLDILRETGLTIEHKEALKLLEDNDCIVDYDNMRARFPEGLVEECLGRCPGSFRVKARDPEDDLIFDGGGNTIYFTSAPSMNTVDLETWEYKTPTEKEFEEAIIVLDALENHDWFAGHTPYFGYQGIPEVMKMTARLAKVIKYSTKYTGQGFANNSWDFDARIARAAGCEITIPAFQVASPLSIGKEGIEAGFKNIEYGFPSGIDTGPLFGATSPVSLAGALAEFNAEIIAGIVLVQLKKPYSRVFVWGFPNVMNMRSGEPESGSVANSLFTVALNQVWRNYKIPLRNTASAYSYSKKIDYQNGTERVMPALLSALSGATSIFFHGGIFCELTHHPVQAILDDDIAGMIGRFVQGIDVNDDSLALELIHEVGPVPGQFIDKKHTMDWWKKETYIKKCSDGMTYPEWLRSGKKDCIYYAKKRMEKILGEHKVSIPLTDKQESEIEKVLEDAKEYYRKKGDLE